MIKFSLHCEIGHVFDSWFRASDACDAQLQAELVACPVCGTTKVGKAIMAPAIARRDRAMVEAGDAPAAPVPPPEAALLDHPLRQAQAMVRALHQKVIATTTDVGVQFPEQARQMHEGEIPVAPIRGQATLEEAKALWEDGIPVLPLPGLSEDQN